MSLEDFLNITGNPILQISIGFTSILTVFLLIFVLYQQNKILNSSKDNTKVVPGSVNFDKNKALQFILERRSIFPKEYIPDGKISDDELNIILEAGNWAPTHNKNEPWRYSILCTSDAIEKYFDFLQEWYENNVDGVDQSELKHFNRKLNGVRQKWPYNVSHLVLIGMRRQSKPDKRLPEWEEISAVAMSVQNMHLMTTSLEQVGGYWSSFNWCKSARDSQEMKEKYFNGLLPDQEDKVFGAFVLGKYPTEKKFHSTRTDVAAKIVMHN